MNATREEIIRIADELIRSKGYHAFSYADISKVLGVKNAAIHYYFPSKSDLGVAVIDNTAEKFQQTIRSWEQLPYETQFQHFVTMHQKTQKNEWVCLMGALSPTYDTLSESMQLQLKELADNIIIWLTGLLENGRAKGVFHFTEEAKAKAYCIQSSLLASLLLNKVLKNDVYQVIQNTILTV
ncbi:MULTISPECIES: TetR/AcrR family transcriptional regulator [Flavobacterium]|uniref:TetR/AcrR family transcriptional regulator n=1 Tax=Flavobacterium TaxID=237 RepID=UPI00086B1A8D|nr:MULTISPECIES: TetR/AcrR family transcriptional regulator [Flavobacterium]MBN9282815.1 TetR/AcrR family transcriptional regulator [Flavobacterium sp.]ODS84032.1 MAG: TetR family transcriptional regulator [Chryseobacterium sp. SCN 40-13]OJV72351.1 MAG: TetR family transcriptional regulator [Flavobacterium sp. 40-81]